MQFLGQIEWIMFWIMDRRHFLQGLTLDLLQDKGLLEAWKRLKALAMSRQEKLLDVHEIMCFSCPRRAPAQAPR
jgi:hypothetical protein